jgi:hydrogenase nickel incorporation protein HypA/HybF
MSMTSSGHRHRQFLRPYRCPGIVIAYTVNYGDVEATMHEITLSQRALEIIEQQAQQAGARRVSGVWLKVGAFSCVEASALTFCFELVCRGTLAEGCELHIAEQQAECWCESCQQYVQLISQHVRRCPQCQSDGLQIVADDGLQIQRIEVIPA